ncbi:MAG: adenylate/guanylate cyclase domain-containing protein, partial [Pseudomonadota bacterium]
MKAAFRQFLDHAISYGTENYELRTQRRLRFINSFVFIIITLLIGLLIAISIFLMLSGSTPFSFGNLTIVVTCLYISVVPFLHRFSDLAAPLYLLASSVVGQLYFQFNIGTAQAGHTFFIFGAASLPFIFGTERKGLPFFATLVLAGAYIVIDYYAPEFGPAIEDRPLFIIQTIKYLSMIIIFLAVYFTVRHALAVAENAENELQKERDRSEMLLQNILPDPIALRLKSDPEAIIADRHPDVAVLFADIVDFTPKAARLSPEELVQMLNRIFSEFDALVETHGLEKIKTVGDAYMVVAGIPDPVDDSTQAIAELALAIQDKTR